MRVHLQLSPSISIVPFDHLPKLTGAVHKWLGQNDVHDRLSLYSFSWLQGGTRAREGLRFGQGAGFFFSAFDAELVQRLVRGLLSDSALFDGMHVIEVQLQETPRFGSRQVFRVGSPVLVKKQEESGGVKHLLWTDADSGDALTATMRHKLREAGLPDEGVRVYFSPEGATPKTKLVKYREVCNKASFCPVVVEGTAEQIAFAWEVGVGNSTGVGFGSLI